MLGSGCTGRLERAGGSHLGGRAVGGRRRDHRGEGAVGRVPGSGPWCSERRGRPWSTAASPVGLPLRGGGRETLGGFSSAEPWRGEAETQRKGEPRAGAVRSLEGCRGQAGERHVMADGRGDGRGDGAGRSAAGGEQRVCNMVVLHQCSQLDGVSSPSTLSFSFF